MNYKVLFTVSFLILAIAFVGLFIIPNNNNSNSNSIENTQQILPELTKKEEVLITTASIKKDVTAGKLLQAQDYQLSEFTVEVDNSLVEYNLKPLIDASPDHSLQGFLTTQHLKTDSLLSPQVLISPNDPKFLVSSIDPKQEVAYRVYIHSPERYILDTLQSGGYVSIYNHQNVVGNANPDQTDLIKLLDKQLVLYSKTYTAEELNNTKNDVVGYVAIRLKAEQLKPLYSLPKDTRLILLPTDKSTPTNKRGALIRKLRG
ncbi:pilus assembly protein CpaB [Bisgaardia hudsonensis]|uniref:Pilus assembly protein CpaB n=1 Tax=Bisgaardia hudsonensis TaxID=109472 RepID=A0A4R2MXW5_9PAST|nr:flp operon protein C [Bisgaardia hudsonensis]QLB12355.1 hypothetical protein A6A11_01355 [Bisgaardia hudsonensis]TCP12404.1 pilus assembly protein CpaB [Bisgaardia hudsonensis]